jgi:adenine deaminase
MELLVEEGFTPEQAIQIASYNRARYLGLEDRIGSIAADKDADLVVVKGDPSQHIDDIENVQTVFKDGVGYDTQAPLFETDDDRLAFVIRLPRHPLSLVPTPEVTPEVGRLLAVLQGEMSREQIMALLGLKDEKHFRVRYQQAAIATGLIEMTLPDTPRSSKQRYRLTATGRRWLEAHPGGDSA